VRAVLIILGIILGAVGGSLAYRAAFIAPPAAVVITTSSAHEVQNVWQIAGGLVLLVIGILIAFYAARRRT
jgi:uncharacterized membrane protein